MTIIAYRAGVMAADTAMWQGDTVVGHVRKVLKVGAGDDQKLVAASGNTVDCLAFRCWVKAGQGDPFPRMTGELAGLVVNAFGWITRYDATGRSFMVEAKYQAIGAAQDFALGALAAGVSAERTVKLAMKHCNYAQGECHVERLT